MPLIKYSISSPHSAKDLYNLVIDIESYPKFLPWCSAARIINREKDTIIAELAIRYKVFFSTYVSKVKLVSNNEIQVKLVDGPFKSLTNLWQFSQVGKETCIEFVLEFELKSELLNKLLSENIESYSSTIFNSFLKRADVVLLKS